MSKRMTLRGFTLVKLLVVIGIIALLISILLPSLNKARQSAAAVQCQSNMRQMFQAQVMYALDNKWYAPAGQGRPTINDPVGTAEDWWYQALAKYIGRKDDPNATLTAVELADRARKGVFRCPSIPVDDLDVKSYAANTFAMTAQPTFGGLTPVAQSAKIGPAVNQLYWCAKPTSKPRRELANGNGLRQNQVLFITEIGLASSVTTSNYFITNKSQFDGTAATVLPAFRHKGKNNVLFLDGSIGLGKKDNNNGVLEEEEVSARLCFDTKP